MYLYRGGRDSMFRIHGTVQNESIGHATSAGCIRLFNQDAIELYNRIPTGTPVKVRSLEESLAIEGPYMDDAWGRAVPQTPENIAKLETDKLKIIEEEAAKAEAERAVWSEGAGLPITVHRPSMVVGEAQNGRVIHFQVFYHLCELKMLQMPQVQ